MSKRKGLSRAWLGRLFACLGAPLLSMAFCSLEKPEPYVPGSEHTVLAELSAGTRYADVSARRLARGRVDVAIPLAQFYIQQARLNGDLRFLGYAEAVLAPWVKQTPPMPTVLVLQATLQQSRHEFS